MKQLLRLMRPHQWVKNAFLFAPLVFSQHLFDRTYSLQALVAFACFCLLSSAVYIINDIADREADRLHPIKKMRPVASGAVSVGQAGLLVGMLLLVASGIVAVMNLKFAVAAAIYFLLNLGYSFGLKRIMIVDVFVIASGFMIRVLAGAFAIAVVVSPWLVLCTMFISVFLAVSKRRAELMISPGATEFATRPVLKEYDPQIIDQMMTVAASGMAISYALYTVADRTVTIFGTENLIFTTVFVMFGIFRYLHLTRMHRTDDNPTHLLLSDGVMVTNMFLWFLTCVLIIYFNDLKSWML